MNKKAEKSIETNYCGSSASGYHQGLQEALFPYQSGWSFFSIWFRIL